MSNTYAVFHSYQKNGFPKESREMYITAFMGDGKAIQIGTTNDYITLTEKQVKDLIKVLQARIDGTVTSTGSEDMGDFYPEDMITEASTK